MNIDLNKLLKQVTETAIEIGNYLKTEQTKLKASAVEMKGLRDYVSYVDEEAEKLLVTALKQYIPNAGFLTEEDTVEQAQKEYTWIRKYLCGSWGPCFGVLCKEKSFKINNLENKGILHIP